MPAIAIAMLYPTCPIEDQISMKAVFLDLDLDLDLDFAKYKYKNKILKEDAKINPRRIGRSGDEGRR